LPSSPRARKICKEVDSRFCHPAVSVSDATYYFQCKFNANRGFQVSIQRKLAFPMSFHDNIAFPVSAHGNLTTGLLELYHDASKNRKCSIELFQCFTQRKRGDRGRRASLPPKMAAQSRFRVAWRSPHSPHSPALILRAQWPIAGGCFGERDGTV
jgi:hypothetical protein